MENELTLEQWKERALVAELLLEQMTQECEGLRAQIDEQKNVIKPGESFTIERIGGSWQALDDMPLDFYKKYDVETPRVDKAGWSNELSELFEKMGVPEEYRKARVPFDRFRVEGEFNVVALLEPYSGDVRVKAMWNASGEDLFFAMPRREFLSSGSDRQARRIAEEFGHQWKLPKDAMLRLSIHIQKELARVRREFERSKGGWR